MRKEKKRKEKNRKELGLTKTTQSWVMHILLTGIHITVQQATIVKPKDKKCTFAVLVTVFVRLSKSQNKKVLCSKFQNSIKFINFTSVGLEWLLHKSISVKQILKIMNSYI